MILVRDNGALSMDSVTECPAPAGPSSSLQLKKSLILGPFKQCPFLSVDFAVRT